ncbi:acyl carrier protein [Streptomyces sp. NPDC046870]|uniref:acyl carrier protein n=1 Tax=Streptomyces sp. NPDC046870 TaxID=3155135 RepID=UPI00345563A5
MNTCHDGLLAHVLTAATTVFGHPVEPGDNFFSLGGDSIAAVELVTLLEERLGVALDTEPVVNTADFAELAGALAAATAPAREA